LSLYKAQLENAQREIYRAQDVIDRIAQEKHDAEEDAARARTKARKLQEEKMVMMAREEGRRQGFKEGLSRGRRIGFEEARSMAYDIADVDDGPEEEIGIRRTTSPENQTMQKNPVIAPRPVRATNGSVL
jgi:flagellar biosynthesis/type III secretory pathway protein FliH